MDRNVIIDRIIRELRRQSERPDKFFKVGTRGKDPDTFFVIGLLDVDRLARAVGDEP